MRRIRPVPLIFGLALLLGGFIPAEAKEKWTRIESPFFTLYAECDMSDARDWAVCFEQFRRYVSEIIRVPPTQLQPLTIVLFRDRQQLMPYLPHRHGKAPTDLSSQTMTFPTGTIVITSLNWDDNDTRQSFYEAGTYWLLSGFKYSGPDWFRAGLAGTFKTFSVTNDEIRIGTAPDGDVLFLREHHLLPLPLLFGINMNQLDFRGDTRTGLFYAESWALVHHLVFGRDRPHGGATRSPQLADFMEALQQGESPEPAFKRIFGTDYDGMIQRLEAYVTSGNYSIATAKFDRAETSTDFKTQVETEAGVEIIHGYASLAGEQNDEARRHFLIAQTLPGGELRSEEALGDMANMVNDDGEAGAHYARAIELGSRSYRAVYFLGDQFMRGELRDRAHLPRFEARLARLAASRFEQAINFYPRYTPSFERLALLMPSLAAFSEDDRQFLELGMRVAPGNELIEAGLGVWELKNNQVEKGQQRLRGLLTEGRRTSGWARLMAQDVADEQAAGTEMAVVRKLVDEEKTDEAGAVVEKLLQRSASQEQRASLLVLQVQIGQLDLLIQAEKLAGDKQWDAAGSVAQSVLDGNPPPALRQRAEAVLARASARK